MTPNMITEEIPSISENALKIHKLITPLAANNKTETATMNFNYQRILMTVEKRAKE